MKRCRAAGSRGRSCRATVRALTAAIDPAALDPNASHPPLRANLALTLRQRRGGALASGSITARAVSFLRQLIRWGWRAGESLPTLQAGQPLLVAFTKNQADVLEPVRRKLEGGGVEVEYLGHHGEAAGVFKAIRGPAYRRCLRYLPALVRHHRRATPSTRESYRWAADSYLQTYGQWQLVYCWLQAGPPSVLVLANDHVRQACILRDVAQRLGVPTVYLQHACVTDRFPPLAFDVALLDGIDATEKYASAGHSDARVLLTGSPKFDSLLSGEHRDSQHSAPVGVCLSFADDEGRLVTLLDALGDSGIDVVVRPHPRMTAEDLPQARAAARRYQMAWSDPQAEASDAFLHRINVLIAGVSAITLEAALSGVTPINFKTSDENPDWYGFIDSGLCRQTSDPDELVRWVLEPEPDAGHNRNAVLRRYCHVYNTPLAGHSTSLVAECIRQIHLGDEPGADGWARLDSSPFSGGVLEREEPRPENASPG